MSYIGIIAEYNPFHNGHKYQLQESLNLSGADGAIALMSGNFTQRGTPAMADKYTRAHAAVIGGLDAVFELPVIYATGSSRDFAEGAVGILGKMSEVDYLAFGVEDDEINLFYEISDILVHEPEEYKTNLNTFLSKGFSYPNASEKALKKILGNSISDIIRYKLFPALYFHKAKNGMVIIKRHSIAGGHSTTASRCQFLFNVIKIHYWRN